MATEKKIKVQLIRSTAGLPGRQLKVVESLGLGRRNSYKVHDASPGILGMIRKVLHLVKVEEVTD